ncbi:thimet oligopeptidase [Trypanosoma cruzi]|nr:thimet oligopeptidase [Trypanosoma cruzi]
MDERALPQIGKEDVNPPLACRKGVAALTSGRGDDGGSGGPTSSVKKGRRHRHRELLVICRARAGVSKSGQVSHRACARCRHSGHDVRVDTRNTALATPTSAFHAVCAPSFYSWASFRFRRLTAVRDSTCQALTQSCGRDRAMTASASAVTLRGIPQCHEENVEPTARPRSASESGTVELLSVTSLCTASGKRRSTSIVERESVAAGTRVGDWDAAARRGTGKTV